MPSLFFLHFIFSLHKMSQLSFHTKHHHLRRIHHVLYLEIPSPGIVHRFTFLPSDTLSVRSTKRLFPNIRYHIRFNRLVQIGNKRFISDAFFKASPNALIYSCWRSIRAIALWLISVFCIEQTVLYLHLSK